MSVKFDNITWNIIEKFFYDNPQVLVKHHLESYNEFYKTGLKSIFKQRNPIILQKEVRFFMTKTLGFNNC